MEVDDIEGFVKELEEKGIRVAVKISDHEIRKDAFGVELQLVEWKNGSEVSLEERIRRVIKFYGG